MDYLVAAGQGVDVDFQDWGGHVSESSQLHEAGGAEVARLRAENEGLRGQLSAEKAGRHRSARTVSAWVMAVIAVLALSLALLLVWTFRTLNSTDLFVDRVGSIIEQPEVATAVGEAAARELVTGLDLQQRLSDALPEQISLAAGPITNAAEGYLAQGATRLIQTEGFQAAWDASLAAGQRITIEVLSGTDTTAVENSDGVIVLNLTPVINALVAEGSGFLSDVLGRDITAPELTSDDIDAAVAALSDQLGVELPSDFGQVVLFESKNLAAAQQAYQVARVSAWLAPLAGLILALIALALAPNRLRVGLGMVIGLALMMLLVAVSLQPVQSAVVNAVTDDGLANAVSAGFSTLISSLLTGIAVVVALGVAAAAVLFLTGGSRTAAQGREILGHSPTLAGRHRGAFLAIGLAVALLVAALIPGTGWGQIVVVLVLYAGFALAVLLAPSTKQDADAVDPLDAP